MDFGEREQCRVRFGVLRRFLEVPLSPRLIGMRCEGKAQSCDEALLFEVMRAMTRNTRLNLEKSLALVNWRLGVFFPVPQYGVQIRSQGVSHTLYCTLRRERSWHP